MLAEMGIDRARPRPARPRRLRHPRPADLPDRRPQGDPGLDHQEGRHRPRGRRRHPHRLPEGLHQGRDRLLRRPDGRRLRAQGPRGRQGPHGGQGLRDGRRRRGGVPLQRLNARVCAGQMGCMPSESAQSPQEVQCDGTCRPGPACDQRAWRLVKRAADALHWRRSDTPFVATGSNPWSLLGFIGRGRRRCGT